MVITKSISRFARNTQDCLENYRKLKNLGMRDIVEKGILECKRASESQKNDDFF